MKEPALIKRGRHGDLTKYDPQKGLQSIAVAETAEKHYARARDATKLYHAIEVKLSKQAEFAEWWDANGFNKAGRPNNRTGSGTIFRRGKNGIPAGATIQRWRLLTIPEKMEATKKKAKERCLQMIEMQRQTAEGAHVGKNSGENEWYTPADLIEAAREVLGAIDLDPATSEAANTVVQAAQIFTTTENGLKHPWHGRVWMNPPYAQPLIEHFCQKLAGHVKAGDVTGCVVLVNNATETGWFQTLATVCDGLCLPKGRVRFWSTDRETATPLQGQAVLYAGSNLKSFCSTFSRFGLTAHLVRS